jgi:hypothetical protein
MPGVSGVVTQADDERTVLWEYWHTIQTEHGETRMQPRTGPRPNHECSSRIIHACS